MYIYIYVYTYTYRYERAYGSAYIRSNTRVLIREFAYIV